MERGELGELVRQFTEAFNREDLDGVMSFMAEDAVYDEFNGTVKWVQIDVDRAAEELDHMIDAEERFHLAMAKQWLSPESRRREGEGRRLVMLSFRPRSRCSSARRSANERCAERDQ